MADRAFSTAAPRTWNQLPTELKRTKSTVAFRRGLKTFLFNRTYRPTAPNNTYDIMTMYCALGLSRGVRNIKKYVNVNVNGNVILVASTPRPISHQPKLMHLTEARLFIKFLAGASLLMSFH